jgi:hypothetical protein
VADYGGDSVNTSYIWSVNGALVAQGIGKTSIILSAGGLGSAQTVEVLAVEKEAARDHATTVIRPATVDMVWEGNTYKPPLYIGRPLPNGQSAVTILAIPHLTKGNGEVPANTLIYTWKINGTFAQKQSGYGRSSLSLNPPRFTAAFTVGVVVATPDGSVVAENSVSIEPRVPAVVVYENAPLLGMRFDKVIQGPFSFNTDEVSFAAYPLFANDASELSYTWSLDGIAFATNPADPRAATFRKVGTGTGMHAVGLLFRGAANFLEEGEKSFQLKI